MELLNARDLFEGKFKPATEEDILKLERELDCTLPQDYKDLTLHYSGFFVGASCRIKNELLAEALNVGDVVDVDIFFGAQATNHPYRIAEYYNRFKSQYRLVFYRLLVIHLVISFAFQSVLRIQGLSTIGILIKSGIMMIMKEKRLAILMCIY